MRFVLALVLLVLVVAPCVSAEPDPAIALLQNVTGPLSDAIDDMDMITRNADVEYSIILVVDSGTNVTRTRVVNSGTRNAVTMNLPGILEATDPGDRIINVHNHPNGVCHPSQSDIAAWEWLYSEMDADGVRVSGNVILCGRHNRTVIYKTVGCEV